MKQNAKDFQLNIAAGRRISFFNLNIINQDGSICSSINHPDNIEKYTLPYVINHSTREHGRWLQMSLIQTVLCCTQVQDYNRERIYLTVAFLVNGYSIDFVEKRVEHFLIHFNAKQLLYVLDQVVYEFLRRQVLDRFLKRNHSFGDPRRESDIGDSIIKLAYGYQYGLHYEFEKDCETYLRTQINPQKLSSNHTRFDFQTIKRFSLNALLSEQKPRELLGIRRV